MEDWHGVMSKSSEGVRRRPTRDEDFEEGDVWSFVNESEDSSPKRRFYNEYSSGSSSAWHLATTPRMIPRANNPATTGHEPNKVIQRSSAPMNIPDWSKIYGKNANLGSSSRHGSWLNGVSNSVVYNAGGFHGYGGDYDNEDDDDMVPPHEWLARKLASNQISSFSVCEGIGRTLKGRDLSKVRNAILTKTGFLE